MEQILWTAMRKHDLYKSTVRAWVQDSWRLNLSHGEAHGNHMCWLHAERFFFMEPNHLNLHDLPLSASFASGSQISLPFINHNLELHIGRKLCNQVYVQKNVHDSHTSHESKEERRNTISWESPGCIYTWTATSQHLVHVGRARMWNNDTDDTEQRHNHERCKLMLKPLKCENKIGVRIGMHSQHVPIK